MLFRIGRQNNQLPIKCETKNLSIMIDSDLSLILSLIHTSYSSLKLLCASRNIFNYNIETLLCDSPVLPNFNFCDIVYDRCLEQSDKNRKQRVQNFWIRFIHGLPCIQEVSR